MPCNGPRTPLFLASSAAASDPRSDSVAMAFGARSYARMRAMGVDSLDVTRRPISSSRDAS
jgi:hypothetical protein